MQQQTCEHARIGAHQLNYKQSPAQLQLSCNASHRLGVHAYTMANINTAGTAHSLTSFNLLSDNTC